MEKKKKKERIRKGTEEPKLAYVTSSQKGQSIRDVEVSIRDEEITIITKEGKTGKRTEEKNCVQ